jgi:hypothetical protein
MSKTVLRIPLITDVYFKLPYGIKTLEDERVEEYYFRGDLFLKLKDMEEEIVIAPYNETLTEDYIEKDIAYMDEEDAPYEPTQEY